MTSKGIAFCNSRNAVNEATADMAMLMMLGILRDIQSLATSVANGTWRGGMALTKGQSELAPTRDPSGLKLGIIGMGAIGKVRANPIFAIPSIAEGFGGRFDAYNFFSLFSM